MKTVLVVDDEENILRLYRDELTECGYNVMTARNGQEALSLVRQTPPDLVTLDIKLGSDPAGIDILRKIKEINNRIPVIINSAYSEFKQNFGVWASEGYVVKSSDLEELKSRIAALLEGHMP